MIASVGAIQSFFMAFYAFSISRKKEWGNLILGLIFLALALRVSKSVLWAFWPETPLWIINIGFAAHLAVGPLFLLYTLVQLRWKTTLLRWNLIHLLPACAVLLLITEIELGTFWYVGGYTALLYHLLIYLLLALMVIAFSYFYDNQEVSNRKTFIWLRNLWLGIGIWGLAYFLNYVVGVTSYLLGPVLYSVIIYVLSFYVLRHQDIFKKKSIGKYSNLKLKSSQLEHYRETILSAMNAGKPYLDPDFTLKKLSQLVAIPPHILSHVINDGIKSNYSEFINSYRIAEASNRLKDAANNHLKIASIAYDCGFNSMSAFNAAFKKVAGTTPSQYRSQFQPVAD